MLAIERAGREGAPPDPVARVDLPDALGGESWYVDLPSGGGLVRAVLGLDVNGAFEPLLASRWAPVPPEGPSQEAGPWEVAAEQSAWLDEQASRPDRRDDGSSPRGRAPGTVSGRSD